jgi:hypothetical protein
MVDILRWQRHIVYPGAMDSALRRDTNVGLRHFPGQGETLYAFRPRRRTASCSHT